MKFTLKRVFWQEWTWVSVLIPFTPFGAPFRDEPR